MKEDLVEKYDLYVKNTSQETQQQRKEGRQTAHGEFTKKLI